MQSAPEFLEPSGLSGLVQFHLLSPVIYDKTMYNSYPLFWIDQPLYIMGLFINQDFT